MHTFMREVSVRVFIYKACYISNVSATILKWSEGVYNLKAMVEFIHTSQIMHVRMIFER